jgi:hypothetical protein
MHVAVSVSDCQCEPSGKGCAHTSCLCLCLCLCLRLCMQVSVDLLAKAMLNGMDAPSESGIFDYKVCKIDTVHHELPNLTC